jgi:hypothetical protein
MITLPLRPLLLVAVLALLVGCSTVIVDADDCKEAETCTVCVADGQEYEVGHAVADSCGSCVCQADGEFHCTQADDCDEPTCVVGDTEYSEGATWDDPSGCGVCSCFEGRVECEAFSCEECIWQGEQHFPGEEFPAGDGCNTCTCDVDGNVSCTLAICSTCLWGEEEYVAGESFPAGDGCNTCTCGDDGSVSCTEIACSCAPSTEWWRSYVATSPEECALIDYVCPGVTTSFQNECGLRLRAVPDVPRGLRLSAPQPVRLPVDRGELPVLGDRALGRCTSSRPPPRSSPSGGAAGGSSRRYPHPRATGSGAGC